MKKLKLLLFLSFLSLFLVTCQSEQKKYIARFVTDYHLIDDLRLNIAGFAKHRIEKTNTVIVSFVSDPRYGKVKNHVYDEDIAKQMKRLKVSIVECTTTGLMGCGAFDTMRFQLSIDKTDRVISYIYSKCDKNQSYQRRYLHQITIKKNWVLFIDQT